MCIWNLDSLVNCLLFINFFVFTYILIFLYKFTVKNFTAEFKSSKWPPSIWIDILPHSDYRKFNLTKNCGIIKAFCSIENSLSTASLVSILRSYPMFLMQNWTPRSPDLSPINFHFLIETCRLKIFNLIRCFEAYRWAFAIEYIRNRNTSVYSLPR